MLSDRYFLNSMWRVVVASCLVVSFVSGVHAAQSDAFGGRGDVEDPYKHD